MTANLENSEVATGLKKKAVFIPISKKGNVKDYSKQSAKTRPGADCGSDHKLLIAKFRL